MMNERAQDGGTGHSLMVQSEIIIRTPSDIVARLATLYPEKFGGDQGTGWGVEFGRILKGQPPERLNYAWDRVMGNWRKATPPLPGHFQEAIKRLPEISKRGAVPKYARDWDAIHQMADNRIKAQGEQHQAILDTLTDRDEWFALMAWWRDFADMVAQIEHKRAWLEDHVLPLHDFEDPIRKAAAYYRLGDIPNPWFARRWQYLITTPPVEEF